MTPSARGCSYDASTAAGRAYQAVSGCTNAVPLEDDCGSFERDCFVSGGEQGDGVAISPMVLGSLEDLQYLVNYKALDSGSSFAASCMCKRRDLEEGTGRIRLSAEGRTEATAIGKKRGTSGSLARFSGW